MKQFLRRVLPKSMITFLRGCPAIRLDWYANKSYSQEGEDMILRYLFASKMDGFYVDVGAHHPTRFSNTYFFYKRGWSGLNIDATPGSMKIFRKWRPRDINVEVAIGKEHAIRRLFEFNDPALNSLNEELSAMRNTGQSYIMREQRLVTRTLADVLTDHFPGGRHVDFMSVDVEGMDLDVLQSNDWNLFRPSFVLVECLGADIQRIDEIPIYQFLIGLGYELFAKTVGTFIFRSVNVAA
jgi:FkbM family methyltransferase